MPRTSESKRERECVFHTHTHTHTHTHKHQHPSSMSFPYSTAPRVGVAATRRPASSVEASAATNASPTTPAAVWRSENLPTPPPHSFAPAHSNPDTGQYRPPKPTRSVCLSLRCCWRDATDPLESCGEGWRVGLADE